MIIGQTGTNWASIGNANRKVFSELSLRNWIELPLKSSFFIGYFTLSKFGYFWVFVREVKDFALFCTLSSFLWIPRIDTDFGQPLKRIQNLKNLQLGHTWNTQSCLYLKLRVHVKDRIIPDFKGNIPHGSWRPIKLKKKIPIIFFKAKLSKIR